MYIDRRIQTVEDSLELLALRQATFQEQRRVETLMKLEQRFNLAHYHGLLLGLAGFLSNWESKVVEALPLEWQVWFVCRRRSVLLKRDLSALGLSVQGGAPAAEIDLTSQFAAWGSLYAMEALALECVKITARLQKFHGIDSQNGGAYFYAGGDSGALWRELLKVLQAVLKGHGPQTEACKAAVQTLRALSQILRNVHGKPASSRAASGSSARPHIESGLTDILRLNFADSTVH